MATLQQLNISQPQPATMRLQAMKMGDELKRTNLAERQVGVQEEELKLNKLKTQVAVARQYIPSITQDNYDDFAKWTQEQGMPPLLKSPEEVAKMTPEQFENYKFQMATGADDILKLTIEQLKKQYTPKSEAEFKDIEREQSIKNIGKAPSELGLIKESLGEDYTPEKALKIAQDRAVQRYKEGRAVFQTVSTSTPGVYYDRLNKKWFINDNEGNPVEISSEEAKQRSLQYKEQTPTNDIKVMQQAVPSVLQLIGQSRAALENTTTGPLAGRWKDLWSGKVGASDPNFRKLKTDINLLQTRLMKMHVGARGGEYIMKHFDEILNAGKDSPANLKAALDEVETYANEVAQTVIGQSATPRPKEKETNSEPTIVKTGTYKGRKVHQMSDGSIKYAD